MVSADREAVGSDVPKVVMPTAEPRLDDKVECGRVEFATRTHVVHADQSGRGLARKHAMVRTEATLNHVDFEAGCFETLRDHPHLALSEVMAAQQHARAQVRSGRLVEVLQHQVRASCSVGQHGQRPRIGLAKVAKTHQPQSLGRYCRSGPT